MPILYTVQTSLRCHRWTVQCCVSHSQCCTHRWTLTKNWRRSSLVSQTKLTTPVANRVLWQKSRKIVWSSQFGTRLQTEVSSFWRYPNSLKTQDRISGGQTVCQEPAQSVEPFRQNFNLWQTQCGTGKNTRFVWLPFISAATSVWTKFLKKQATVSKH